MLAFPASKNASWIVTEIDGVDFQRGELTAPFKIIGEHDVVEAALGDYKNVRVKGFAPEPAQWNDEKPLLGAVSLRKLASAD